MTGFSMRAFLLGLGLSVSAVQAQAATQAYLQIPGVQGDATDRRHEGWIIIESVRVDIDRASRASGAASCGFTVTKRRDSTSPALNRAAIDGRSFKTMVIDSVSAEGRGEAITLNDAVISAVRYSSARGEPGEDIILTCTDYTKREYSAPMIDTRRPSVTPDLQRQ